jgi:hypothetical protein
MCSICKPFWEVTQNALVFTYRKLKLDLTLKGGIGTDD